MATKISTPAEQSGVPGVSKERMAHAKRHADKIRKAAGELWDLLEVAHREEHWRLLGYRSWKSYVEIEFDMSKRNANRLVAQGTVIRAIEGGTARPALPRTKRETIVTADDASVLARDLETVVTEVQAAQANGAAPRDAVKAAVAKRKPPVVPSTETAKEDRSDDDEPAAAEGGRPRDRHKTGEPAVPPEDPQPGLQAGNVASEQTSTREGSGPAGSPAAAAPQPAPDPPSDAKTVDPLRLFRHHLREACRWLDQVPAETYSAKQWNELPATVRGRVQTVTLAKSAELVGRLRKANSR